MPAYIQHRQHHEVEPFAIVCPCCFKAAYVRGGSSASLEHDEARLHLRVL